MADRLDQWERASRPPDRVSPPHSRRSAAPPSPAARVIELTRMLEQERAFLAEACVEIRALRREADPPELADVFHSFSASFAGVPASQYWVEFMLWEVVLNDSQGLNGIIEIGTWQGGFSLWLDAQARARGTRFITHDVIVPDREIPGFTRLDVWANPERIAADIAEIGEPLVLFCDGGNKPRELATFSKLLSDRDSLIFVHDWGTETLPSDVPAWLEPIYERACDDLGSITRIFRIKEA